MYDDAGGDDDDDENAVVSPGLHGRSSRSIDQLRGADDGDVSVMMPRALTAACSVLALPTHPCRLCLLSVAVVFTLCMCIFSIVQLTVSFSFSFF